MGMSVVNEACAVCSIQLVIISVNCVLAGGILMQGGEGGRETEGDRRRQTARADVSVSPAPCPTCIFKEQLCFLLLLLLHANYRKRR